MRIKVIGTYEGYAIVRKDGHFEMFNKTTGDHISCDAGENPHKEIDTRIKELKEVM
jgi:hypothetical protein